MRVTDALDTRMWAIDELMPQERGAGGVGEDFVIMFRKHELETVIEGSPGFQGRDGAVFINRGTSTGTASPMLPEPKVELVDEIQLSRQSNKFLRTANKAKRRVRSYSPIRDADGDEDDASGGKWEPDEELLEKCFSAEKIGTSDSVKVDHRSVFETIDEVPSLVTSDSSVSSETTRATTDMLAELCVEEDPMKVTAKQYRSISMPTKVRAYSNMLSAMSSMASRTQGTGGREAGAQGLWLQRTSSLPNLKDLKLADKMVRNFQMGLLSFLMESRDFQREFHSVFKLMRETFPTCCRRRKSRSKYYT
mmetsp:Transcript_2338/g.7003  ORF Transcript_2338/g.7003 Transcript_2338/m.7003 type:complete len:307 (-) Transcript_2338:1372-2292(-)